MIFKNVPVNYKTVVLSSSELNDAISGWLQREHPGTTLIASPNPKTDVNCIVRVPVLEEEFELKPKTLTVAKQRYSVPHKRPLAGIGKELLLIFKDGFVHNVGNVYATLKPMYPTLTRKSLTHNFYNVSGVVNLGGNNWQLKLAN